MLDKAKKFLNQEFNYIGEEAALNLVAFVKREVEAAKRISRVEGYNEGCDVGYEEGYNDATYMNRNR